MFISNNANDKAGCIYS